MHNDLPGRPERTGLVMSDETRGTEQRHHGNRLELLNQASQQRPPNPRTTPLRRDDHILHIRAQDAVSHRPGKPNQLLAVPRTNGRCRPQHSADLLGRALRPPALRPIQLQHTFGGNLALAMRHHCSVTNIRHTTDSGPAPRAVATAYCRDPSSATTISVTGSKAISGVPQTIKSATRRRPAATRPQAYSPRRHHPTRRLTQPRTTPSQNHKSSSRTVRASTPTASAPFDPGQQNPGLAFTAIPGFWAHRASCYGCRCWSRPTSALTSFSIRSATSPPIRIPAPMQPTDSTVLSHTTVLTSRMTAIVTRSSRGPQAASWV